jgi:ABC-2 type transport system permease protein
MRKIAAIMKKELSIYFTTIVGYACFAGFALLLGYMFLQYLQGFMFQSQMYLKARTPQMLATMNLNDMVIAPTYYNALFLFLFIVPFLTMRLLAEEKRMKTFELLMTVPVTPLQMVLGKYFAAVLMIGAICLTALIHPLILSRFATGPAGGSGIEWTSVCTGIVGVFLLGAAFVAYGLFASALAESPIMAALLAFVGLLVWWLITWGARMAEGWQAELLAYLSPMSHVEGAIRGVISTSDLVYFFTAIATWLFLCHRVVESHRWR